MSAKLGDELFQSTLLQEERLQTVTYKPQLDDFNPRSYKRSDAMPTTSFP